MNWPEILRKEARENSVILADELAEKYSLDAEAVRKALWRHERTGLVERVTHKVYVNHLAFDFSPTDLVRVLRSKAYVSLGWALHYWGISTQTPRTVTCVTTEKPAEFRASSFSIGFRSIAPRLFYGAVEKHTRYAAYKIAEPEKALLDWVYLSLQNGFVPGLEELDFRSISRSKLVAYAKRYPATVREILSHPLATETFAA